MIRAEALIPLFQRMYREHWSYVWGKAEEGCVDCSGAFVWAFRQLGGTIAHGSNSIARKYISGELLPLSEARPGMAAFKCREWADTESGNRWYGKPPGDVYHVGLVDSDPNYVLNAKGTQSGFCRDKLSAKNGWDYVAYLSGVEYNSEVKRMQAKVVLPQGASGTTVNARASANRSAKLLYRVPVGSTVEVLSDQGEWCQIKWADKYAAWMMSNYLEYDGQTGETDGGEVLSTESRELIEKTLESIEAHIETIRDALGRG